MYTMYNTTVYFRSSYLVFDSLSSLSVDQCVSGLLEYRGGGADVCNHDCHTITTKASLSSRVSLESRSYGGQ